MSTVPPTSQEAPKDVHEQETEQKEPPVVETAEKGKGKKQKKKKDKNAPRRAKSAYIFFTTEMRPKVLGEDPAIRIPFGDVARKLAMMWRELPEVSKEKYNQMALEDKKRYQTEMANYVPPPE